MSKKIIKPAEYETICDMCGKAKQHFWLDGIRHSANMGYIQAQSDCWPKDLLFHLSASVPYQDCKDICTDCVRKGFERIIKDLEKYYENEY